MARFIAANHNILIYLPQQSPKSVQMCCPEIWTNDFRDVVFKKQNEAQMSIFLVLSTVLSTVEIGRI
jgi:hypothetical protein